MGNFSINLFTKIDDLEDEEKSVETYIEETGSPLTTFIEKCNGHYFAINNKAPNEVKETEVKKLLFSMDTIVNKNEKRHFTNEIFQKAEVNFNMSVIETKKEVVRDGRFYVDVIESNYESKIDIVDQKKASLEKKMSFMEKLKEKFQRKLKKPEEQDIDIGNETTEIPHQGIQEKEAEKMKDEYNKTAKNLNDIQLEVEELNRQRDKLIQNKMDEISSVKRKMNDRFLELITDFRDRYDTELNEELKAKDEFLAELRCQRMDKATGKDPTLLKKLTLMEEHVLKDKKEIIKKHERYFDTMFEKSEAIQHKVNQDQRRCVVM